MTMILGTEQRFDLMFRILAQPFPKKRYKVPEMIDLLLYKADSR